MNKKVLVISMSVLMTIIATTALAQVRPESITGCTTTLAFKDWDSLKCPSLDSDNEATCNFADQLYDCPMCCFMSNMYKIIDLIFYGITLISVGLTVLGAYKIMTAGGNPENVNTGRNYIMWAMIGLGVALIARSIPQITKSILRLG